MTPPNECPTREWLRNYFLGKMKLSDAEVLEEHLETCDDCLATFTHIERTDPGDTVIRELRNPSPPSPFRHEEGLKKALARAAANPPADAKYFKPDTVGEPDPMPETAEIPSETSQAPQISDLAKFERDLIDCGAMTADELARFKKELPKNVPIRESMDLAVALVRAKRLSKYQAGQLYKGSPESLVTGDYCLIDELGSGGMGKVYRARHRRSRDLAAVKVLAREHLDSKKAVRRFQREARATAKLTHPNIVHTLDAGDQDGRHYLAIEYIDGQDLADIIRKRGPINIRGAVRILRQAAEALQYAHSQDVIHRDVKPHNLLVDTKGRVKLLDLGLALFRKSEDSDSSSHSPEDEQTELTGMFQVMGTVDFMSPEQSRSTHTADERSDIYSLGATFYHMLVGEPMYSEGDYFQKIYCHRAKPIPSLLESRGDIPDEVDIFYQTMVAKDPSDRFQTMGEVLAALDTLPLPPKGTKPILLRPDDDSETDIDTPSPPATPAVSMILPEAPPEPAAQPDDLSAFLENLGTAPRHASRTSSKPAAQPKSKPDRHRQLLYTLIGLALTGLVLMSVLVIKINRDRYGTLTIEAPSDDSVIVTVSQDGREVDILDASKNWTLHLDAGDYTLTTKSPKDTQFRLSQNQVTITNEETKTITWTPVPLTEPPLPPAGNRVWKLVDMEPVVQRTGWGSGKIQVTKTVAENSPTIPVDFEYCNEFFRVEHDGCLQFGIPEGVKSFTTTAMQRGDPIRNSVSADGKVLVPETSKRVVSVRINLPEGAEVLELRTSAAKNSRSRCYWIMPRFHTKSVEQLPANFGPETEKGIPLVHLKPQLVEGKLSATGKGADQSVDCPKELWPPIPTGQDQCGEVVGAHAPSRVDYDIPTGATRFHAIGINHFSESSKFIIEFDGVQTHTSEKGGTVIVDVPIPKGAKRISLVIDSIGSNNGDITRWCYPRFYRGTTWLTDADKPPEPITFGGHRYELIETPMTWHQAFEHCRKQGGYLCCLETDEERDFVVKMLGGDSKNRVWLGASDQYSEGEFKWINGSEWEVSPWASDQPSNDIGAQHYLALHANGEFDDDWGEIQNRFLCEYDSKAANAVQWPPESVRERIEEVAAANAKRKRLGFQGHSYLLVPEAMCWSSAKQVAEKMGGYLCCVETRAEQEFLHRHIYDHHETWLGGTDEGSEGDWRWINNAAWENMAWSPGSPSNWKNIEHHLHFRSEACDWNDAPGGKRNLFICEWDTIDRAKTKILNDPGPLTIPGIGSTEDEDIPPPLPASEFTNKLGMKFVLIPAGEFMMGSPEDEKNRDGDEGPVHRVRITKPFYMGIHEVTLGDFKKFVSSTGYKTEAETDGKGGWGWNASTDKFEGRDPKYTWRSVGFSQTDSHPVVNVTWNDAVAFVAWLGKAEGKRYALPTEAQWEYACRSGTTSAYSFGSDPELLAKYGNVADGTAKRKFGSWTTISAEDGYVFTSPVGSFRPNAWGLYDMHGNVWEWCEDWYNADYYSETPTDDPPGPSLASYRVNRGGGWGSSPRNCRAAGRDRISRGSRYRYLGFRLALVPAESSK